MKPLVIWFFSFPPVTSCLEGTNILRILFSDVLNLSFPLQFHDSKKRVLFGDRTVLYFVHGYVGSRVFFHV